MYSIVFVHELGHITMALIFNWNIKKINIYPFGGYTIFDENINKPILEEFLVFMGGILFQIIFYIIFSLFVDSNTYINILFNSYNFTILIFNMLPIIPLDGSKILNILINFIFPFKKSHLIIIYISYILILLIILLYKDINMLIISILLLFLLIKEHKNHIYLYNSFLLGRYFNKIRYKKNNIIIGDKIEKIKKYFNNIFVKDNKYIDEKEIIKKRYKNI